ncbi:MAG: SDR family oxidoreductase [bacterium]
MQNNNNNYKIVLVTGSSRGIGKAIAKKFAENNNKNNKYKIIINGVKREKDLNNAVRELSKIIEENGGKCEDILGIMCDISDYSKVTKMFDVIENKYGEVDILINNAGVSHIGLFSDMKEEEWDNIININLKGVINCSNRVCKNMIKNRYGNIVNISSIWGEVGGSCEVVYSATKGAINAFTKSLGKELGSSNIKVNAISCGLIETEMNSNLNEEDKNAFIEDIAMMRIGKSEEVANLVYYLCSEESNYITSQVIRIDGGYI